MKQSNQKIETLQNRINDLESKKQIIQNAQFVVSKSDRKKRTRTLIQVGALLKMLGFFELCDIVEGDDLEKDQNAKNHTAVLIGILESLKSELSPFLSDAEKEHFKNIGIRVLKMHSKL